VLGIKRDLRHGVVTATVLIDGTTGKRSLCPAAAVQTWTGPAAAPVTIEIDRKFYAHFSKTAALAAPFDLRHFEAGLGDEAGGGGYIIDAVVDTGMVCELSVAAVLGGAVLSALSWLTLPLAGDCTGYQLEYSHVEDGSSWG
jgi:hypothetical protein